MGLEGFCTPGDIWCSWKKGIQTSRDFQLLITKAEEKKKNLLPKYSEGGASYPYPGIPTMGQEDGFKPINQSKTLPIELKRGY